MPTFIDGGQLWDVTMSDEPGPEGGSGSLIGFQPPTTNGTIQRKITPSLIHRSSVIMNQPSPGGTISRAEPTPENFTVNHIVNSVIGRVQIVADGKDITYYGGYETQIESWESQEPGDDSSCVFYTPVPLHYTRFGNGVSSWVRPGASIDINFIPTSGPSYRLWEGFIMSVVYGTDKRGVEIQCKGALFQTDVYVHKPRFDRRTKDIVTIIADMLDGCISRKFARCTRPGSGIYSNKRGAWGTVTDAYTEILSTAYTADGLNQWTLTKRKGRVPYLQLKDKTTHHWTVSWGQPGVDISLTNDLGVPVTTIYGEGTSDDGGHWRNTKYPNFNPGDVPIYPLGGGGVRFLPGDSHTGFDPFADEMRNHGYRMYSKDTYDARDRWAVRDFQRRAGIIITADDGVGAQTWATLFQPAANGANLYGCFYAPLYSWSKVEPRKYNANGADLGPNPAFDPKVMRVERYENYGEGISKQEGIASAYSEIYPRMIAEPLITGTITFNADPENGSRFFIKAGHNIFIKYVHPPLKHFPSAASQPWYAGAEDGVLLHVSRATVNFADGTVSCDVSYMGYDRMTLADIKKRNTENSDPGRRPLQARKKSKQTIDDRVVFDSEAGAGFVPKHALYPGVWTVLRVPFGEIGSIVKTDFTLTGGGGAFAIGVFGKPITANTVRSLVHNPLGNDTNWTNDRDALLDRGLLIAYGSQSQPCGYYPGLKSDGHAATGRFVDTASWDYESTIPPWVWLAEYSPGGGYIRGRFWAGVDDL